MYSRIFIPLAISFVVTMSACDRIEEHFILVNCSNRTITVCYPRSFPASNRGLFNSFKRSDPKDTIPFIYFSVAPGKVHQEVNLGTFGSQFVRGDKKMRLLVVDMDSVRAMCKKEAPDSGIVKSLVLKEFQYTQDELEKRQRIIAYWEE